MTGSNAVLIVVPIVMVLALALWLSLVMYAGAHPEWKAHRMAREAAAREAAARETAARETAARRRCQRRLGSRPEGCRAGAGSQQPRTPPERRTGPLTGQAAPWLPARALLAAAG